MLLNLYDNKSDGPVSLKGFLQTCRSCIKSLENVGVVLSDQSHVIIYMVTKKLSLCKVFESMHLTEGSCYEAAFVLQLFGE